MSIEYSLPIPQDRRRTLAFTWLMFAVAALLVSGLFVILIVVSRVPGLEALFPGPNFFRLAIVVHVDFSVLVWFSAVAAMFWTLTAHAGGWAAARFALVAAMLGVALMALAPFQPGEAIMSNYVPVLDNVLFLAGLVVFGIGIVAMAARSLVLAVPVGSPLEPAGVMRFGVHSAAVVLVVAAIALLWSWSAMPDFLWGPQYYETLFWGSGHVMQFAWTQLMIVGWLWLASAAGVRMPLTPRLVLFLLLAGVLPVFLTIWAYLLFDVGSPQHREFFIWLMAAGGGVAAGPIGIALFVGWLRSKRIVDVTQRGLAVALVFSIILFGIGGGLGFMIDTSNTIVPAHYHGCIVAITLVFMSLALHLLPAFGYARPSPRLVLALPWVYGVGQILHVAGLAVSGGHGVQRKTATAEQGLEGLAQVAGMAVMGLGALVAIIGGIVFLVAVIGALRRRVRKDAATMVLADA